MYCVLRKVSERYNFDKHHSDYLGELLFLHIDVIRQIVSFMTEGE